MAHEGRYRAVKHTFTPEQRSRLDTIRAENGADPIMEHELEWYEQYADDTEWDALQDQLRE